VINDDVEIIDSFFKDFDANANPMDYLAASIKLLAHADVAYFVPGWEGFRGCKIEHEVAVQYGVDRIEPSAKPEDATYAPAPAPAPAPVHTPLMGSNIGESATRHLIDNAFTYHAPKPGQPERYTALRDSAKELALRIMNMCPFSRERSLAETKLEESVMWANAAIARNE
jgi:hypothetical protein